MSDPGYRSTREAARARVEALEAELRESATITTQMPEPSATVTGPTDKIRAQLFDIRKRRTGCFWVLAIIAGGTFRTAAHGGAGAFSLLMLVVVGVLYLAANRRSTTERALDRELRAIIKTEDEKYARFRVESAPIRKRIADEKKQRARLEQELAEARAMIEEDENETGREKI